MSRRVTEEFLAASVGENRLTPQSHFFRSDENVFIPLGEENEEDCFWKKEARRYVAFLSSTGTLPVPLPLPRDCPANRQIGG